MTTEGKVAWQSPSNLALVKYWGKHGNQLPQNPSISFTLKHAHTETTLSYVPREGRNADAAISLEFFYNGQPNQVFQRKTAVFLESILPSFPFLKELHLTLETTNSFPHGAGIASSASGMSALALCLCSIEEKIYAQKFDNKYFTQKASYFARLGSGSACRSVFPTMAVWGFTPDVKGSSDEFAVGYEEALHPIFKTYKNAITIVSRSEKSVSSRAGHALMEGNIYAESRYQQARLHLRELLGALQTGDLEKFGEITENEALILHALMMASKPSFILLHPNSLAMIARVRDYRKETKVPLYFSLDAGPNLHLLYPDAEATKVEAFIRSDLQDLCEDGFWIADGVGAGPIQMI